MLTLIENGFVYAPEPRGVQSVLLAGAWIEKIAEVDKRAIEASGLDLDVVDAPDCWPWTKRITARVTRLASLAHDSGGAGMARRPLTA